MTELNVKNTERWLPSRG